MKLGVAVLVSASLAASASGAVIDDFEDPSGWSAAPADGVSLTLRADTGLSGRSLRLDFDFHGHGGYAIARRALDLPLPENYAFVFSIRGEAPRNDLEFKLIDPSGENVWWNVHRGFEFGSSWRPVVIKKRKIAFAWGPARDVPLSRVGALELAITAGSGGRGTVWIDELELRPLPPEHAYTLTPQVTTSVRTTETAPRAAMDGSAETAWVCGAVGPQPCELTVDFLEAREFGGVVVDWTDDRATDYDVEASFDGADWRTIRKVRGGWGKRDWLELPDSEARYLRLAMRKSSHSSYGVREIDVRPLPFGESPNAFFSAIAQSSQRGLYPRYLLGQQVYWTIVGVSGGVEDVLVNEDGCVETGKGGPSVEPFLDWDGKRIDWSGVTRSVSLLDGDLPVPTVTWTAPEFTLDITTFADGPFDAPTAWVRYRLTNAGRAKRQAALLLALRPFQVNPPWQFLGTPGGATSIRTIHWNGTALTANDRFTLVPVTRPFAVTMLPFDSGDVVARWEPGRRTSPASAVDDPVGYASAGLSWRVPELAPGASWETAVAIPLGAGPGGAPRRIDATGGLAAVERRLTATKTGWRAALDGVGLTVPQDALDLVRTLRSNLAYTLINRRGPAIQPGSRAYARSWIRDGALSSSALLRLGHADAARAFAEWYARYQYPDGKVPCCVDLRGADPVPENDSHGELIHVIFEVGRYTNDRAFLERMWPHVAGAVDAIDRLRKERRSDAYRASDKRAYFGLLPESISHEGYSDKARHSYWDDFFTITGLDDAVRTASVLGKTEERMRIAAIRDEFRADLLASIAATMELHGIDYLPGCVELGDFDAPSSTVALDPAGLLPLLPGNAVAATFERYHDAFVTRRDGGESWESYTPYELRTVGAFVRLGWTARAHEALSYFARDRRPEGWNAWAEVVWRDPLAPRFIGDLPHSWVGTDFIRSLLDLFVYEDPHKDALVVAAGIPETWAKSRSGVGVHGVRTPWGPLSWSMRGSGDGLTLVLEAGLEVPPGGILFKPPGDRSPREVTVNGAPVVPDARGTIAIRALPAEVRVIY